MSEKKIIYITCILWIFILFNLPVGFKTYVDEAYFILGLNQKQDLGIQHSQFFQITRFIFRILHVEPVILCSRIICYVLSVISLLIFSIASFRWLNKKENIACPFGLYLSLVFLYGQFIFFSGYEISLSFNHLHVFFVSVIFSLYLLWDVSERFFIRRLLVFTIGCFSFLAILNYFPASILITLVILFLVLLKRQDTLTSILLYIAGMVFCAIIYNFMVYPVSDAVNEIVSMTRNPSFGTGRYDLHSYLLSQVKYAKNLIILFLCCCGIYFLSRVDYSNKRNMQLLVFFLFGVFLVLERSFLRYNIALVPILLVGIAHYLSKPVPEICWKDRQQFLSITQKLIFFFFPYLAVMGTNVDISYKILYFAFLWIFLLIAYLYRMKQTRAYHLLLYLTVGCALFLSARSYFSIFADIRGNFINSRCTVDNNKQFNHIRLKKSQLEYFQQIDSLLQSHSFNPEQDRIFVTDTDYAVLLYLNATNYGGLMHSIENMPAYSSVFYSAENEPDYIIVLQSDRHRFMNTVEENFKWNFPGDYTEYLLDEPDHLNLHYAGHRSLFVRNK